jgi:membrane-associated protein
MELIGNIIDFFLHLDKYLNLLIHQFGISTYVILFLVIFCETGLVVTPFLPGDSLLFAAGAFAGAGITLDVTTLFLALSIAAVAGNMVNYQVGLTMGPKVLRRDNVRFLKREYLDRTHRFYQKYGGRTLIIARFVPIIRTFAPFLAGVGKMTYLRFSAYNVVGSLAWTSSFIFGGYFFGNIPAVKQHFTFVIFGIIIVSLIPTVIEFIRHRR